MHGYYLSILWCLGTYPFRSFLDIWCTKLTIQYQCQKCYGPDIKSTMQHGINIDCEKYENVLKYNLLFPNFIL